MLHYTDKKKKKNTYQLVAFTTLVGFTCQPQNFNRYNDLLNCTAYSDCNFIMQSTSLPDPCDFFPYTWYEDNNYFKNLSWYNLKIMVKLVHFFSEARNVEHLVLCKETRFCQKQSIILALFGFINQDKPGWLKILNFFFLIYG